MAELKIELNSAGVRALLHEAGSVCRSIADDAASSLGDGYEADTRVYPERTGAVVKAVSQAAAKENEETNSILTAVWSAGGG